MYIGIVMLLRGIQENKFRKVGTLMAMFLAQQGSGFPFFRTSTFWYLCSKDITSIDVVVEETPYHETKRSLIVDFLASVDIKTFGHILVYNGASEWPCIPSFLFTVQPKPPFY